MRKDVLSLSIIISFVTIHVKGLGEAVGPIFDTSGNEIRVGDTTKYYIIPVGSGMEKYHGLTSKVRNMRTYVYTIKNKTTDLVRTVTFSFGDSQEDSQFICIQFASNNKWWVNSWNGRSSVMVSNNASQAVALFTIEKVAGQSPEPVPCYHICYGTDPLGIAKDGHMVVRTDKDQLLQVVFQKVAD